MDATTSSRRFWTLNALAWAGYAMYGLWAGCGSAAAWCSSGIVLITVSVACLWLCSGMLRAVALRQRWWEEPGRPGVGWPPVWWPAPASHRR